MFAVANLQTVFGNTAFEHTANFSEPYLSPHSFLQWRTDFRNQTGNQSKFLHYDVFALTFCKYYTALTNVVFSSGFAKLRKKKTISFVMSARLPACLPVCLSVCPHKTSRLPQDGFSLNFISKYFSKISIKLELYWNMTRITGTLHEDRYMYIYENIDKFESDWNMTRITGTLHEDQYMYIYENIDKFEFDWNTTRITGTLHEDRYMYIYENIDKFEFDWNMTRITGTLHEDRYMYIYENISLNSFQNEKCFRQKL